MIKMVVSSFYNTLIDSEEAIPTSTMLEIERIRKKGIIFSVCTNRSYKEVLDYNKDFPFIDYIISLNGSYVYDVISDKCLFKNKITKTNVKKISTIFENKQIKYYGETKIYNTFDKVEDNDIYKIEVEIAEDENLDSLSKLSINKSIFEKDNKTYLEITSSRSNMFNGVDKISIKTGIKLSEVLVITCNDSDVSLVSNIKNSYIMKNCYKTLKKLDTKKTLSNDSKGVEKVLKQL